MIIRFNIVYLSYLGTLLNILQFAKLTFQYKSIGGNGFIKIMFMFKPVVIHFRFNYLDLYADFIFFYE